MKFIKKHKILLIIIGIIIIFSIVAIIFIRQFLVDYSKDVYGDRLDNIDKVEISKERVDKLESDLKAIDAVSKAEYDLRGRLINVMITVKEGTILDDAKTYAIKVLEYFEDDEKQFYDIQVFLKNENEESEGYPTIGYKHKTSENLVWN